MSYCDKCNNILLANVNADCCNKWGTNVTDESIKKECCRYVPDLSYCGPYCQTSTGYPTSSCCAYFKSISWQGVASYTKQACCTGSTSAAWRDNDPDAATECCGNEPNTSTSSTTCCEMWYNKSAWYSSSSSAKSGKDACCNIQAFRDKYPSECVLLYPQVQLQVTCNSATCTLTGPCDSYTGLSSAGNSSDVSVSYTRLNVTHHKYGKDSFVSQTTSICTDPYKSLNTTLTGSYGGSETANYQLTNLVGAVYSVGPAANLNSPVWLNQSCCSGTTCKTRKHGFTGYPNKYKYRHKILQIRLVIRMISITAVLVINL